MDLSMGVLLVVNYYWTTLSLAAALSRLHIEFHLVGSKLQRFRWFRHARRRHDRCRVGRFSSAAHYITQRCPWGGPV